MKRRSNLAAGCLHLASFCERAAAAGAEPTAATTPAQPGAVSSTRKAAAPPGHFWPGSNAAAAVSSSSSSGGLGSVFKRGMLTGFNTQLAVGPGGLVIGPAGSEGGLRPRPKSSHTAAVESIARRQATLQVRPSA